MNHTVEDAVDILMGHCHRSVAVRVDFSDQKIMKSISSQISKNIGLTDRQRDLILKKIKKYRQGLELNSVDVDQLLESKITRLPLRELDRTQSVTATNGSPKKILIKFANSKNFYALWEIAKVDIVGKPVERSQIKEILFNEINVSTVVKYFKSQDFTFDREILDFYDSMEKIRKNPEDFLPYADVVDDAVVLKNANRHCVAYLEKNFADLSTKNFLAYLDRLKNCGIYHKTPAVLEKIKDYPCSEKSKTAVCLRDSRFRILPTKENFQSMITVIEELDQWPVLFMVDDDERSIPPIIETLQWLMGLIPREKISVFFRLSNEKPQNQKFNQFVKDQRLNNYIDIRTTAVFVPKNRIPKPLLRADWQPRSAVVMSKFNFGRSSAYLDDIPTVYYYNNSVSPRNNRVKGPRSIVEL